jgi:3-(3-hydroxy-phenyl)propionate hydroxylase
MHEGSGHGVAVAKHAVVIAGEGPTGLMLAGELALARIDVAIVERRENQERTYYARVGALLPQSGVQWRPFARGR